MWLAVVGRVSQVDLIHDRVASKCFILYRLNLEGFMSLMGQIISPASAQPNEFGMMESLARLLVLLVPVSVLSRRFSKSS